MNESVIKTLIVALIVCLLCSLVVSSVAVSLRDAQNLNKLNDQRIKVLQAAGIYDDTKSIEEQYNSITSKLIDFENNAEQSIAIFRAMARLEAGKWDERLTNEMLLKAYESSKISMDDSIYSTTDWITDKEAASQIARNLAEKVIKN